MHRRGRNLTYQPRRQRTCKGNPARAGSKTIKQVVVKKTYVPKCVVRADERKAFMLFRLRAVGPSSAGIVNSEFGRQLTEQHWLKARKILEKAKPKNEKQFKALMKKIMDLPEQQFLLLNEATSIGPLTPKAFKEYLTLFQQLLPKHWKALYGKRNPADIVQECNKANKAMKAAGMMP